VAKSLEGTVDDIIATMHAHPTMAESMHEAALGAEGRMIHG
jgi:dihydrolipoamide dehydrogenase